MLTRAGPLPGPETHRLPAIDVVRGIVMVLMALDGFYKSQGQGATAIAWLAMLVALVPVCRWYLGVKRRHPQSVLRFV